MSTVRFTTVLSAVLLLTANCFSERDTKLTVEGGNPPLFTMRGSGKLDALRVGGPTKQREGLGEDPYLYWVIQFKETGSARLIEDLSAITYGEVPSGYVQVFPSAGQLPPVLLEDQLYNVRAITINANGAVHNFAIHAGKVVVEPLVRDGKPLFTN